MLARVRSCHHAFRLAVVVAAAVVAGGCETIGSDLSDLARGLSMPTPGEAARMAVDPGDADRRREGTLLLANAPFGGDETYVRIYRDYAANERDPLVRSVAIRALARHGEPDDAMIIAEQLTAESLPVRWEAAKGLQRLHQPDVVPALLRTIRQVDETPAVREACAIAAGQYPQDRVFQALVSALDARDLEVNVAAAWSMRMLTGQDHGLDPRPWLRWYNDADDPFAGGQEYLYPTYTRPESWFEKLAFWSTPLREQPAPPVGLRSAAERTTYDDDPPGDGGE
ncbi:MAG: HEAT repeat domain-containing protein [Phycisphaerales bacterium]|nr:HEAT repeat domain-containing protein [Phycisphaerales bacterium]